MVSVSTASRIVFYPLVRCAPEQRHIGLHKGELISNTCLLFVDLLACLIYSKTIECSNYNR